MREKTYRIIGDSRVLGRETGAEITEAEFKRAGTNVPALIEGGHIEAVESKDAVDARVDEKRKR